MTTDNLAEVLDPLVEQHGILQVLAALALICDRRATRYAADPNIYEGRIKIRDDINDAAL